MSTQYDEKISRKNSEGWVLVSATRVLSVDRGKTTILVDREYPTELVLHLTDEQQEALRQQL